MADFSIAGNMKVATVKKQFTERFGSTLRVYNGTSLAADNVTIGSIAKKGVTRGSEVSAHGGLKVSTFEKAFKDAFGVRVRVASPDNTKTVSGDVTLSQSAK